MTTSTYNRNYNNRDEADDEESTAVSTTTTNAVPALPQSPMASRVEFANLVLFPPSALTLPPPILGSNNMATTTTTSTEYDTTTARNGAVAAAHQLSLQQQQSHPSEEAVVLLQARSETCQELMTATTAFTASGQVNLPSIHTASQPQQQQQLVAPIGTRTQIQGVVDLDVLSAIAGVSRSDFVADWQQQPPLQAPPPSSSSMDGAEIRSTTPAQDEKSNDTDDIVEVINVNEGTPLLLSSPAVSSISYQPDVVPYVLAPATALLHNHNNYIPGVTDTVLLKADAFVDTLTDVLENRTNHSDDVRYQYTYQRTSNHNYDDDDIESMTRDDNDELLLYGDDNDLDGDATATNYDDVSGVTPGGAFFVPRPENLGANILLSNHRQHAFLIEIPPTFTTTTPNNRNYHSTTTNNDKNNNSVDVPSHFILAFPQDGGPWQDDVSEASNDNNNDDNESFLLGLSHLPTDVCDVQIEATQYNDTETIRLDVVVKRQVPIIGYIILIGGLLSLSSVGSALNLQANVSPIMKSFWRYTSTWIVLLPITVRSIFYSNSNSNTISGFPQLSMLQWIYFVICSMCYAFMTSAFVIALSYTTLANAFVLSNLAPLFIIVGRTVLGYSVLYMEGIGAMIGFMGGTVCAFDQAPTVYGNGLVREHPKALLGDSLAVMASAAVAIYLLLAKKLRPHIDLFVFTFLLMFVSSIFVLLYMIITKEPMSFSNHIDYGLWGWTNWQWNRLPLEFYLAFVCNIVGTTGYIAVMKYFEPIVVSTVMLSEPIIGSLLAAAVGSDPLPGIQTWLGNIVVAVGIFLVVWSGARSTETIDATKALLQVNHGTSNVDNNSHHHNHSVSAAVATQNTPVQHDATISNGLTLGVPLLKHHPVTAATLNNVTNGSPHRFVLRPNIRTRCESIHEE
jgi:drug/metabolite transporter (DMT)-like permease